ncbi:MAG: 2-dehydropantoate 2-reductase [Deltaproteobacteria bacterium]|nr:2-dehydropantoate 2-reductase [Deltaproteobacteria bacterium]
MENPRIAVLGIGATGATLAAALLSKEPKTILVDPAPGMGEALLKKGITISGSISYSSVPVRFFYDRISDIKEYNPYLIFISTKTFALPHVLNELEGILKPETKIISTHNGLGTEDFIAERFGPGSVFRMSLNFGVELKGSGEIEAAFFNRPNHIGCLVPENRERGKEIARMLTDGGLDTEFVEDIKLFVWKKMIMKCTMASICAVTDKTIKDALDFSPTREIADACFEEILAVAKAKGYDLGEEYLKQIFAYLEKVGAHKDSMCYDISNQSPTEIDFLGGKVVEYASEMGISVPFYTAMTNLVKALENNYLGK